MTKKPKMTKMNEMSTGRLKVGLPKNGKDSFPRGKKQPVQTGDRKMKK